VSPQNETKRHRILDAARQICSQNGYEAARMDDIAHVAGVSKGTLYNFFESKESLLIATVLATHEDFVVVLPAVSDPNLDPRLRLEALIESLADGFDGITQHIVLSHLAWTVVLTSPSGRQQLLTTLRAIYSGYEQQLQSILQAGIESGALKPDTDIPVVVANWIAIYDGLLYRAGFEDDEPNPAYTPAGVRRSLGWLTEQLLNPGSARQEKFALEKGTVRP
jgi:AcrR family transcriptional regulator